MNRLAFIRSLTAAAGMAAALSASPAQAASLVLNGGFESGFANWTRDNLFPAAGSGIFSLQSGIVSPLSGVTVPAPPGGVLAAMTDSEGPGAHVLYQDFFVPLDTTTGSLSFQYFIHNFADNFFVPNTLDWSTPALNQRARVDIMRTSATPFSVAAGDVLYFSETQPGDDLIQGYVPFLVDISGLLAANAGNTLRLRFSEVDNVQQFLLGLDNISIETNQAATPLPEPATLLLVATGVGAAVRRRRRSAHPR